MDAIANLKSGSTGVILHTIEASPAPARVPHLLIADDDPGHRLLVAKLLRTNGFRVSLAPDGEAMLRLLEASAPDLLLLDIMLPGQDGLELCRRIRATSNLPIIMLTALGGGPHKVAGLDIGADDYVAKPFDSHELLARIRAVLRRAGTAGTLSPEDARRSARRVYRFEGWRVDAARREVISPSGVLISLTSGEFDLLLALLEHPQVILTREHLVELTRQRGSDGADRSIDILISRIRRKMEANSKSPEIIKTVRSGGYLLAPSVTLGA